MFYAAARQQTPLNYQPTPILQGPSPRRLIVPKFSLKQLPPEMVIGGTLQVGDNNTPISWERALRDVAKIDPAIYRVIDFIICEN